MGLNIGSTPILDLKVGSGQVDKVYLGANQVWSKTPAAIRALKFSSPGAQTVHVDTGSLGTLSPSFEYSTDGGNTWTTWSDLSQDLSFGNGTDLYLRGMNTILANQTNNWKTIFVFGAFDSSNYVDCTGNIMHLFDYTQDLTSFPSLTTSGGVYEMFSNAASLRTAPDLPATAIPDAAYRRMFYKCSNLQHCPALPAMTLTSGCYYDMFRNCSNLQHCPALPAMTLASACYYEMFMNCPNLEEIPALPATTLASNCYYSMLRGCSKVKMSLTQDSEYPNEYVFGTDPSGYATDMFYMTGGAPSRSPTQTTYYTPNTIITQGAST